MLIPLVFLALFFFYPLFSILGISLFPDGVPDLSGFTAVFATNRYVDILLFTAAQAALSTFLTLILALPGAYVFARLHFPGKALMLALATLPFVLPTVVVAAAFNALLGENGIANRILMSIFALDAAPIQLERTLALVLIAHVFYNYAVALRMISGYWANQSPRMEEAARILGAYGWKLWWYVRLPVLRPAISASAVLVFIFSFTSFGVILVLGGPRLATLEVEIYRQVNNLFNLPVGAALSIIQIAFMFGMMAVYTRLQRRNASELQSAQRTARRPDGIKEWAFVGIVIVGIVLLIFSPLVALIFQSLSRDGRLTLLYYNALSINTRDSFFFVPPLQAVFNSLVFAVMTMVCSVILGLLAGITLARPSRLGNWLDPLFMLPLATSAVTLGFGFIIALDEPPLNLRTSPVLIPIAHTLVAMPFVVRSVLPALRGIPSNLREAARVMGASPWQVWRWVDLPLISRGVLVGAMFAFTVSMGEFGASLFIARPEIPTMPVVIFRLLGLPGDLNYGQGLAMSVLLLLVCAVGFAAIERLRTAGVGEF